MGLILGVAVLATSLLSGGSQAEAVAPPATQCNAEANAGGQGIACTVTIVNYVTLSGSIDLSTPSTVTMTRCVGAAGPVGAGAGTCTTTVTTSTEPVTLVRQCNGSGSGGGGVVICVTSITNYFNGSPTSPAGTAGIYQCIGSVITGPGAPGSCTPANTPGVTSVPASTIGQCTGSGNGGTSVEFQCTASAPWTTATLPINIDQCNGSGNGGGALTRCSATLTNNVASGPALVPATPSAPAAAATPVATPAVAPVVVPTTAPVLVPTPAPSQVQLPVAPVVTTIRPPATGNAGLLDRNGSAVGWTWVLVGGALALIVGGRVVTSLRRR